MLHIFYGVDCDIYIATSFVTDVLLELALRLDGKWLIAEESNCDF